MPERLGLVPLGRRKQKEDGCEKRMKARENIKIGQKGWSRTDCAIIFDNDGYLYIFRASEFDWNGDALLGRFRHQRQFPQIRNGLQVSRNSSIAECCKENAPTIFRISTIKGGSRCAGKKSEFVIQLFLGRRSDKTTDIVTNRVRD